jgi:hypothetical protein
MRRRHNSIKQQITRNAAHYERISITIESLKKNINVFSPSRIRINHWYVFDNEKSQQSNSDLQSTIESELWLELHVYQNDLEHLNQRNIILRTIQLRQSEHEKIQEHSQLFASRSIDVAIFQLSSNKCSHQVRLSRNRRDEKNIYVEVHSIDSRHSQIWRSMQSDTVYLLIHQVSKHVVAYRSRDALNPWTLYIDHSLDSLINRIIFIPSIRSMLTYLIESRITIVEWWIDTDQFLLTS